MTTTLESVLREIIVRHGSSLLEDQRRCASVIRDTQLSSKEIAGLIAALNSGIPARLVEHGKSGLPATILSTYVAHLSDETGLNENLARSSLEAWAFALRIDVPDKQPERQAPPAAEPRVNEDPQMNDTQSVHRVMPTQAAEGSLAPKAWAIFVWGLYICGVISLGISTIVGIAIAYLKRGELAGTPFESHMTSAIRTFWISLIGSVPALFLAGAGRLGEVVLVVFAAWPIFRVVRGLVLAIRGRPIEHPKGWL